MPKKLPPPLLPISAFQSSNTYNNTQADQLFTRRTPLVAIDAHVSLPTITKEEDSSTSTLNAQLWLDSVSTLCTRQLVTSSNNTKPIDNQPTETDQKAASHFRGFIYIHQQPTWLLDQNKQPQSDQTAISDQWQNESQKITKIDQELSQIQPAPPLGQVIWAPLHQGPTVLLSYLERVSKTEIPISGCCHLIERKSTTRHASLTEPEFIQSLKLLGERNLSLEFMVDGNHERSASAILEEVQDCVAAVRQGQDPKCETKFILCQMGMPEMISTQSLVPSSASYSSILSRLFSLSLFSEFHIKLSSLPLILEEELNQRACDYFIKHKRSNLPPIQEPSTPVAVPESTDHDNLNKSNHSATTAQGEAAWREVKKRIKFYLEPILEAFGDYRLVYASGFPYFDVPQLSRPIAEATRHYEFQFEIFRECLTEFGLENEALDNVFGLNAQRCYNLQNLK